MEPVLIEVRCNLAQEDPQWEEIASLSLEVGYRGLGGKMLWKSIGWLREQLAPAGRSFAHALWKPKMTSHILIFDFLPVMQPDSAEPEKTYRIRKSIATADGRLRVSRSGTLRGDYSDEHFSLHPQYPNAKDQ